MHVVFSVSFDLTRNTEEMEISTQNGPTHLPSGPSALEPKLPFVRCNVPSTLEDPTPAVTSRQFPCFPRSGAFANVFSFRLWCPPYSDFTTPVTCSSSCRQSTRRSSILGSYYHYALSKIRNKDVHVQYFTSSCVSDMPSPPSKTPCWTFKPEDLYISIGKDHLMTKRGSGSAMAALRQVLPRVRSKQGIHTLACPSISSKC